MGVVDVMVRPAITEPLTRVLRWMARLRDGSGRILCPEHRVEHTGKSAGAIVLACELLQLDPDGDREFLIELAVQQGRRLVSNLVREGVSPCFTFRPGRHDPYNCSNSVIDGGACSDALVTLVETLGEELEPEDREAFHNAAVLHARTYLRYAVVDKGVPAQRAWGLTGLTAVLRLEQDERMRRAAYRALEVLRDIQHPDGSYPYHPLEWGAGHPGASDVSAFYQSRVTGFLLESLESLGEDPTSAVHRPALEKGTQFLSALYGPDGVKTGLVEAKPWYWGASYEVASHPFDIYALARAGRLFADAKAGQTAVRSFAAWLRHLSPDGKIDSHHPGPGRGRSYQCSLFWAGHTSWLGRAARDLEFWESQGEERSTVAPTCTWFEDAQLARLEDDAVIAWVRGARPGCNVHHGSPHGAGLLRCVRKADGEELIPRCRLGGHQVGEWSGVAGSPVWKRGWTSGKEAVRFSVWIAKTHRRAGRLREALREPFATFKRGVLAFGAPRVSSAFELRPEVRIADDAVELDSFLAFRDGSRPTGTGIERKFQVDGDGLIVTESLISRGTTQGVDYRLPAAACDVTRTADTIRYRLR